MCNFKQKWSREKNISRKFLKDRRKIFLFAYIISKSIKTNQIYFSYKATYSRDVITIFCIILGNLNE